MLLRAIEEKRFLPVGSDKETNSEFQLIAGTNCELHEAVNEGRFREDLLARINLWTFCLPRLADRLEDLPPNLDYELSQFASRTGQVVRMNKEARERFLQFATSSTALWKANFRDLNAAVTRMSTLAAGGRITVELVDEEVSRLTDQWGSGDRELVCAPALSELLSEEQLAHLDLFDRVQLETVVNSCRESKSLSDAGWKLFAASRQSKKQPNDADRLRKYLARFGLDWEQITS
jgi:transcriptional regulatory protein RtcR